jgi:uncharacterized protein YjdB
MLRRSGIPALLLLAGLGGCIDLKNVADACSVTAAPSSLSIPLNGSAAIVGTAFDCKGNSIRNKKINYSSTNPAIATVTIDGNVIGVAVGNTTVSAVADGHSASVAVTVTPEVAATVQINPSTLTLRKNNVRQLTATARNNQNIVITGRTFQWSSSNSAIVQVDQNGNVTALAPGAAVVTAMVDQTVGQSNITVTEIPIGSCSLTPTSSKVTVTQSVQPTLTLRDTANNVIPSLNRPIVWTSSNEIVATVTGTGLATTRRAGNATITASSVEYPSISCQTAIEAVDPRITQVIIQQRTGSLRLGVARGFTVALLDSTNNQVPAGRIVTWSTNTPQVVQVTQAGIVTGISLGTARIIATSEGVADTVTFTVTKIPVATVVVNPLQSTIAEGATVQLNATVTDSAGTIVTDRTIEWLTSDPTRATVNGTGLVTGISAGSVSVGATVEQKLGQATVLVQQIPVDTITAPSTFSLKVGQTSAFAITLLDRNGNVIRNRNVVVTSDFPGIANGAANTQATLVTVTGFAVGEANLTIQALNNNGQNEGKATKIKVTVTP